MKVMWAGLFLRNSVFFSFKTVRMPRKIDRRVYHRRRNMRLSLSLYNILFRGRTAGRTYAAVLATGCRSATQDTPPRELVYECVRRGGVSGEVSVSAIKASLHQRMTEEEIEHHLEGSYSYLSEKWNLFVNYMGKIQKCTICELHGEDSWGRFKNVQLRSL